MGMFASMKSLAYHKPGEDDPYITLKDVTLHYNFSTKKVSDTL